MKKRVIYALYSKVYKRIIDYGAKSDFGPASGTTTLKEWKQDYKLIKFKEVK